MTETDVRSEWLDDAKLMESPPLVYDAERVRAFDALIDQAGAPEPAAGRDLTYELPYPKYEFLCYLADRRGYLLHGSNAADIGVFEPRMQPDAMNRPRKCVYATPDGIWPMYFALIDRARYRGSLRNRFVRRADDDGTTRRYYRFSINEKLLRRRPWQPGTIYILPAETFEPTLDGKGRPTEEWASSVGVRPAARIAVEPADFPFLDRVEGHDDTLPERLTELQVRVLGAFDSVEQQGDDHWVIRLRPRRRIKQHAAELVGLVRDLGALSDVSFDLLDADDDSTSLAVSGPGARPLVESIAQLGGKLRVIGRIPGLISALVLLLRSRRLAGFIGRATQRLRR
jgi:hypothetical protein